MARRYYPALIHKDEGSSFGISFPDVPGCISAGDSLEECLAAGEQALNFHLEGLAEAKQSIPDASDLRAVTASAREDNDDGTLFAVQMIPAFLPGKTTRVTLTMPEDLLARIDAASGNYERSGWIAAAAQAKLAGEVEMRVKKMVRGKFKTVGKIKTQSGYQMTKGKMHAVKSRRAKAASKKVKARARA
jgi:predicted RNase H-like HicB family nuclease